MFSFRTSAHRWDPKNQRPELWNLYNGRKNPGESIRVFPLSNWTELDIWQYIYREQIPIVPLYFAAERPVVERDGMLMMVDDDRLTIYPDEQIQIKKIRFRTLGCYPLTGAIESDADDLASIVLELLSAKTSERQGTDDRLRLVGLDGEEKAGGLLLMDAQTQNNPVERVNAYLEEQASLDTLRFITCGSVDDGKSTLIGRMLFEAQLIFEDQVASLRSDSKKMGTQGGDIDFALLVDGLAAEREQGITIDVAYRFFATEKRKFIVADTPGHEQYTRNMVTGASTADVAVILIDARQGVLTQTRRHSMICASLGIKNVVLAVNKMDLMDYSQEETFDAIEADYRAFADELRFETITAIPVSALKGDNVVERASNTQWYKGPTLLGFLETVETRALKVEYPLRFPVQWVNRPDLDFRGFSGTIEAGRASVGQEVRVLPSGETATVRTSSCSTRTSTTPRRDRRSRSPSTARSTRRGATSSSPATRRARSRTSSRSTWSGWTRSPATWDGATC